MKPNAERKAILFLILFAAVIRLWGISYGLPAVYNSTEYFLAKNALSLGARHSLEPLYFIYPTLFTYVIAGLFALCFGIGWLTGSFHTSADFAAAFLLNPTGFYLAGRLLNGLVFILALGVFFKLLRRAFSLRISVVLSLAFLASFNLQFYTRWMTPDALLILGTVLVLAFIMKWIDAPPSASDLLKSGVICGLTISTKYNAGFLALGLLGAVLLFEERRLRVRSLAASAGSVAGGFILGSPYWLLKFSRFAHGFESIWSQSQLAYNSHAGVPFLWVIKEMIRSEWLLGLVFIVGMIYPFIRRERRTAPLILIFAPTILVVGGWSKQGLDYLLVSFPVILILMGILLSRHKKLTEGRRFLMISALVLMPSLAHLFYLDFVQSRPDTRELASSWIKQNIPPGTSICYDHYHYDLQLIDIKRFTSTGEGAAMLPTAVKKKLWDARSSSANYVFISPREDLQTPSWPKNFDSSRIKTFSQNQFVLKELRHPFRSLPQISEAGAEWLILNSETYRKYLDNPALPVTNPLWENFRNKQIFYRQVFDSLTPVIVFKPNWLRAGPVIRIYRLRAGKNSREKEESD